MAKAATTTRKARTPVPAGETKAQKFSRLGTLRLNKALSAIRTIGNLSGAGYEYSPEQVAAIEQHLNKAITNTLEKFSKSPKAAKETVTL